MNTNPIRLPQSALPPNDRLAPRWKVRSIACAVQSDGRWHDVAVVDVSLTGIKVAGRWGEPWAVTAVSLTDDLHTPLTGELLIVESEVVWVSPSRLVGGLQFDVPNRDLADRLFRFLSRHIAQAPVP